MPRLPRHKSQDSTFYHCFNRVAGDPHYFPFRDPRVARQFLTLFQRYLQLYCCRLASFQLLWNHFHAVLFFELFRRLPREELHLRARLRFGPLWRLKTACWSNSQWLQFNHDLFDVSCFMHHVQGEFAKWFNRRHGRRGPFWADRFKNPELLDLEAVQDAILYTELNSVRAGLVKRPENYRLGSAYWRYHRQKSSLLIPLEELFPPETGQDSFTVYRARLYYRGAIPTKAHQAAIPDSVVRLEQARGFACPGLFRQSLSFFTQGIALGDHTRVQFLLEQYRQKQIYSRRRHPIPQLGGLLFSLREQRSHAFAPG